MVVVAGLTVLEVKPSTEPTPLSTERLPGASPESAHDKVDDCPKVIVVDEAIKPVITGAKGFTITVTCLVALPVPFVAVKV